MSTEPPPDAESDALLRARLRAGDPAAFSVLFRSHVDQVHALALRWCGDRASAEDVAAETFLVAWRRRAEIADDDRPLRGWLLAIATNQALNVVRGRRRRTAFLGRQGPPAAAPDIAEAVAARLDDADELERTHRALATLSRAEQQVLSLCVWGGLSRREAAAVLDVPVGTVGSRLARARARLRSLVDDPPSPAPARRPLTQETCS